MLTTITNSAKTKLFYGVRTSLIIVFIILLSVSIFGSLFGGLARAQSGLSASVNGTIDNAEVKLFGNGQKAFDIFGGAISVSQGKTIVGSRWADVGRAGNAGAAYIFSQDVNGRYQEEAKLQPTDIAASDEFGAAVAIDGDIAVVGAFRHDGDFGRLKLEDSGAVYVYNLRANGNWILQAKLEPSDATAGLSFGRSVAIENNTLVVGAAGAGRNNTGAFYVYELDKGDWIEGERITPPRAKQLDEIGAAIAIDGNTILVSGAGANDAGTAYIYRRSGRGWQVEAALSAGDNKDQTYFGYAVALDNDVALVGALGDDSVATDAGAAYVFERQANGDWKAAGKLSAADAARDDKFGGAVALQNGVAVVAAEQNDSIASDAGAIYLFSRQSEGNWQLLDKVTAIDANRADHFGSALAIDNGKLAVGALRDDDLAENSGSAYVYDVSSLRGSTNRGVASTNNRSGSNSVLTSGSRGTDANGTDANKTTVSGLSLGALNTRNNDSATAVPVLAPLLALPSGMSGTSATVQSSASDDFSQIRANNGNNNSRGFANQRNVQQVQYQGQLNQGTGTARNLGSSQGLNQNFTNNQGFGNQNLNQGLNQGLNSSLNQNMGGGLNSGQNTGFGTGFNSTGVNRNLGSGQNLNQGLNSGLNQGLNQGLNNGLNQGFGLNNNQGLSSGLNSGLNNGLNNGVNSGLNNGLNGGGNTGLNSAPLFAAPSGSGGLSSSFNSSGGAAGLSNNNFNNAQNNNNQGEGFLGLGRFFRNPNRPRVEEDSTPRLSDITEQPQQNNGFLGLGKLRNLGNRNNNAGQGSGNATGLNRDTRMNSGVGFSGQFNQGLNNQGLNNQGLNNQGLNNQNTAYTNIMNLRDQTNRVGDYVELELPLFDTPVVYLSGGLPQGLQLDSREGVIFGEIARGTVGNYDVVIQVDDGQNQLTEGFSWRVNR